MSDIETNRTIESANGTTDSTARCATVVTGGDLWRWYQWAQQEAIAASVSQHELDWFVLAMSDVDRLALRLQTVVARPTVCLMHPLDALSQKWQQRTQQRVPVQYLVGQVQWRDLVLQVSPAVLIPRPETELIIDLAIALAAELPTHPAHWVDLGTGSGAIALSLAQAFPHATLHAVDVSAEALAIARHNAQSNHLADRIQFYQGNWFEPIAHLKGQLSGLVSNPPYIPTAEVAVLQPEVTQHEPHLALDGGTDGLDCIRLLAEQAPQFLRPSGVWLIEMMTGQGDRVAHLLEHHGQYTNIQVHFDLGGCDRFVSAHRKP
ncbi:peptide chain release factor N(5)-glutamine methyltransferase [Leptolyngbya sp. AN02str]|uniref:peptide chain release factor N(5)-glutamine methyltransferase n=1 Tax=Leptolyngbya sp. AN02str TaxID=3423363 RepID=UPI003D316AF7